MTRARGDEEMSDEEKGEEEEGEGALDLGGGSFRKLVLEWNGPDLVYSTVNDWIVSDQSGKPTVGNFFQYCFDFSENIEEDYELRLWMLNLVAHYVAEEKSWMDSGDDAKDWGSLLLNGVDWDVPPPVWAKIREQVQEEKEKNEKTEESLEDRTSSPLDPSWGKGLPAPSPTVAALSTPVWRPWEEEEDVVVNLSAAVQKRKRRSPAAAARSRRRLQQWQEMVDRNRLESELRTTPLRSVVQMRGTRLLGRLEGQDRGGIIRAGSGGSWMEGKTVFVSNQTQTSMLPQSFQSPMSTFAPVVSSPSSDCRGRLDVPNVVTLCPACRAWGLLTPT